MIREVISIDEQRCDGCGLCVPSCAEGAVQVIEGKARLVSDVLCDGLGACLSHCPLGAIKIERREAARFDEWAVREHLGRPKAAPTGGRPRHSTLAARFASGTPEPHPHGGCPSSRFAQFADQAPADGPGPDVSGPDTPSELTHWPVQLKLLSPTAPVLCGAKLLVAADCVPVAYADFHTRMLRGRAVVIACPKLDDTHGYVEKLTEMIRHNDLAELSVAHMQVPCCAGIIHAVLEARRLAGSDLPVEDIVISVRGEVLGRRRIGAEPVGC